MSVKILQKAQLYSFTASLIPLETIIWLSHPLYIKNSENDDHMRTKFLHTFKRALRVGFSFHCDEMGTKAKKWYKKTCSPIIYHRRMLWKCKCLLSIYNLTELWTPFMNYFASKLDQRILRLISDEWYWIIPTLITKEVRLYPTLVTTKTNWDIRCLYSYYLLLAELRKTWQRNKLVASIFVSQSKV